jgi:metal-sulfur cluster biosynthetic enzyme
MTPAMSNDGIVDDPKSLVAAVYAELDKIIDPCSAASVAPMGLNEMGLINRVEVSEGGDVDVFLRLTSPTCQMIIYMAKESIRLISDLPGVTGVRVHPDEGLDWDPSLIAPAAAERRRTRLVLLTS